MTLLVLRFITRSSWSKNSSECFERKKRTSSNSIVKGNFPNRGENFQTESIIGTIEDDILLDGRIGWIHEVMGKVILTWHRDLLGHPVGCMKALFRNVKQEFETNKERLMFNKSERSSKLRANMRLVVATRFQVQQPSFWLCTSSNAPSILKSVTHESFC
jgi:hypothetical protein